ncbi:MAG: hypothetical protein JWM93_3434 [Frankiales bacterium]|nr:hypothetical protein [Frankiales bacterium]
MWNVVVAFGFMAFLFGTVCAVRGAFALRRQLAAPRSAGKRARTWVAVGLVAMIGGAALAPASTPALAPPALPSPAAAGGGQDEARTADSATASETPRVVESVPPAAPGTALAALTLLAVKGRAPLTGFSRAQFGPAWSDVDRNGCDTRNDVLRRDLTHLTIKAGTRGCKVLAGDERDPYTAKLIRFIYGGTSEVDIDHVVALADSWQKGAQQLSVAQRTALANDPLNLLAVDASANRQKGSGDAATWLPANNAYRCGYVARQVSVKAKYRLSVTPAERDAIVRVLTQCPDQLLVVAGPIPLA